MFTLKVEIKKARGFIPWPKDLIKIQEAEIPSSWGEMKKHHLRDLGRFYAFDKMDPKDEFKLIKRWSGLPEEFFMEISELEILELIKWIYADCSFPESLLVRYGPFIGAKSFLKNFSMDRFGLCDTLFKLYIETSDPQMLRKFCAVYFRAFFLPFSTRLIDLYVPFMHLVPRRIQMAALINFVGLRKFMMEIHPNVFTGKGGGDNSTDWEHITLQLAGGVFGDMDKTRKQKIPVVLKYCEMSAKEAQKMRNKKRNG